MSSLRDLQRQFVGALFDELPDTRAGLEIYRNNLHEGFCKVLALEFPVIQRLVGADHVCELSPPALGDRSRLGQVLRIEPEQRQCLEQLA